MKRLLIVLMLLTGCAQKETIQEPPQAHRTTVYRYTNESCEPAEPDNEQLRQALKSRDQWKRYAERLEKLPGAKIK
ncbi:MULTISPECIES: hypothetical protein [unclassified Pseudomonas]|uniref:Uncharacterized protein n=1 Tax=viral metagenome TaxID=1070528 RepID=A0A6M3M7Z1_9ZZZZ|nr:MULTISPECIES: hypothetical protein [unclassified Pseudomonas]MBU0523484.1 hypothetical protein [Gammaproteobacteria bacterium]MBU0819914.1 hypothetical protein [Gammaproteobacteria bacterium]MBU0842037.1 hypothetical protein [Gammaproteobacteria bacterium]MBU1842864.1 hypothetical protein [Gammaproteobacteria bacterium]PMV87085.1 hypothetical protein C1X56_12175 [Pseudomonas sp. GW101-1A09]